MPDLASVSRWIDGYVRAWNSNDAAEVRALFTVDAQYSTEPYNPPWHGSDAIVKGWLDHQDQPGETTFDWEPLELTDDLAVITGTTRYPDRSYSNLWIIRLADDGRCRSFAEWWMKHPKD